MISMTPEERAALLCLTGTSEPLRKAIANEIRAAVDAEREACCRDVCPGCADGLKLDGPDTHKRVDRVGGESCHAADIRARAEKH